MLLLQGGRWGTTSCALAQITRNSGRVVTVEPDTEAHAALLHNRAVCRANFHVLRGTIGSRDMTELVRDGYGTRTVAGEGGRERAAPTSKAAIPRLSVRAVEDLVGSRFDTVLIDCEGCGTSLVGDLVRMDLDTVVVEDDSEPPGVRSPRGSPYARRLYPRLYQAGLRCIAHVTDSVMPPDVAFSHLVWRRGGEPHDSMRLCDELNRRANGMVHCRPCTSGAHLQCTDHQCTHLRETASGGVGSMVLRGLLGRFQARGGHTQTRDWVTHARQHPAKP